MTIKNLPRQLFLIDGIGALVSAFSLGVVLVYFEAVFGMPRKLLIPLALTAVLFALYSLTCYWKKPGNWQPFLRFIAIVNLLYCGVTICLVLQQYQNLTGLGITYFILELAIVIPLALFEWKTAGSQKELT
ncbi:MAG: hypothetical protein AAGF89_07095 [Bacteroidota bacterium]